MFETGKIYKRGWLHDRYGGSRQSGIAPSAKHPFIFIFTGAGGKQHGYKDKWENKNVFSYTGEGQVGDMQFTKGNLQLRDHIKLGKRVFLFEYVKKAFVKYIGELEAIDCDYFETHDRNENLRVGIKFFFKRRGVNLYTIPEELNRIAAEEYHEYEIIKPNVTERSGLVTSRVGQGAYRKSILHRWEYKCAATGYSDPRVLIASHIVPWKVATDEERLDVDNGILLSPDYDALFDTHQISFEDSGKIILSSQLINKNYKYLGVSGKERIKDISEGNKLYLQRHRERIA